MTSTKGNIKYRRRGLTPHKVILIYFLVLLLVGLHEMGRIISWAEGLSLEMASARQVLDICRQARDWQQRLGLAALPAWEHRVIDRWDDMPVIGFSEPEPEVQWRVVRRVVLPSPPPTLPPPVPEPEIRVSILPSQPEAPDGPEPRLIEAPPDQVAMRSALERSAGHAILPGDWPELPEVPSLADLESPPLPEGPPLHEPIRSPIESSVQPPAPAKTSPPPSAPQIIHPQTVLIAGDSMVLEGFGVALERRLQKIENLKVVRKGKYSSGLTRPDYFDWDAYLTELMNEIRPDLVILHMGANDPQDILTEDRRRLFRGNDDWNEVYAGRAARLIEIVESYGARAVWVGMPIMGLKDYTPNIANINRLVRDECKRAAGCSFVDTWLTLADANSNYTNYLCDSSGRRVRVRAKDKVHLTEAGGEIVVDHVMATLRGLVDFSAQAAQPPSAEPAGHRAEERAKASKMAFLSQSRGKKTAFWAYVPQGAADRRYPVLYLLHGAWDDYNAWTNHAAEALAVLAQKYGLIIVTPDGDPFGWYADSPYDPPNQIETYFVKELIPFVESNLPAEAGVRGATGLSMGGHGALVLALRNPGLFAAASSMSGILDITAHPGQWQLDRVFGPQAQGNLELWQEHSAYNLIETRPDALNGLGILITVSTSDQWSLVDNRRVHELLTGRGAKHAYEESPGGHDWNYWTSQLPVHVAFQAAALVK